MEGPSAFSSDGAEVIARQVDLVEQAAKTGSLGRDDEDLALEEYYEVEYTVQEILRHDFKRIALQFPDDMLGDSVPVYTALKKRLHAADASGAQMSKSLALTVDLAKDTRSLFVLADTSYGSCCVDEVAAQHVNADAVVHYGHACMSPTSRLPVIYIFGKRNIDHRRVVEVFYDTCPASASVVIFQEGCYNHCTPRMKEEFEARDPSSRFHAQIPSSYQEPGQAQCNTTSTAEAPISRTSVPDDATILYIGGETLALTNLLMTHGDKNVYRFDPKTHTCKLESLRTNKLLMKRYHAVLRAKDADVFGILIGTLGVASYLPLISHLRALLKKAHKKSYTVSVGKLNPAKLANFAEIECFVLVACPENSVVESKEFFRPIVTPFELEMALGVVPAWSGRYILDFEKVIAEVRDSTTYGDGETTEATEEDGRDEPHFSLITGKLVTSKRYGDRGEEDNGKGNAGGALVPRNQDTTLGNLIGSAAGEFLQTRSWQGLEQRIGLDEPSVLEQGRDGIAKGYRRLDGDGIVTGEEGPAHVRAVVTSMSMSSNHSASEGFGYRDQRDFPSTRPRTTAVLMTAPVAIRLISHNIRYATTRPNHDEALWVDRKHLVIAQYLYETRFVPGALLGLQEVLHSQLLDILDGLNQHSEPADWEYIGVGRSDGKKGGEMSPILYRSSVYRLIKFTNLWLSETPDVPSKGWDAPHLNRIVTIGEFEHRQTGRLICAMNTHFDDGGAVARRKSAELIVDRAKGFLRRGYGLTLTGDFNSKPTEDAYQTVQNGPQSPFVDVASLFTTEGEGEGKDTRRYGHVKTYTGFDFRESTKKRIDYAFVAPKENCPWDVRGVGVLETRFDDGVADSDHRPVVADIVLKGIVDVQVQQENA